MNDDIENTENVPVITEAQLAEQRVNLQAAEAQRDARATVGALERDRHLYEQRVNQRALEIEREAKRALEREAREKQEGARWRFFRAHHNVIIDEGLPLHRWIMRQDVQMSYGGLDGALDKAMSLIQ